MAGGTKRKSSYKSDHFVASDNDSDRPAKRGKGSSGAKVTVQVSTEQQVDDNGDTYWELSGKRRVAISEFNRSTFVNIREYYEKDGKALPGKKGISLTIEQYSTILSLVPQIEQALREKGHDIPRPDYSVPKTVGHNARHEHDEDSEDETKKANIEATSDEED